MSYYPVAITAATLTLNQNTHADVSVVVNRAAGSVLTLPAAYGSGCKYSILVGTTITSNNLIIQVANGSDVMTGNALSAQDAGDTALAFETAVDTDTITMNGTTKGGVKGDRIELEDVGPNLWAVNIFGSATGTEVTPFSAAVS
jgi:hypothetical protein